MGSRELAELAWEWWASKGVPCFPCNNNKEPLTEKGHLDATADYDELLKLFENAPNAKYIGAAMGEACGLFAVDFDLYKGETAQRYKKVLETTNCLPPTRVHQTKSGGEHYIYFAPEGKSVPRSSVPADGVEVKGEGGYIIVPPSPDYEVISSATTEAPKGLLDRLESSRTAFNKMSAFDLGQKILDGSSFHEAATMIAAKQHGAGHDPITIQENLIALFNASVAANPNHKRHDRWMSIMSGNELGRICSSAYNKFNPNRGETNLREVSGNERLLKEFRALGFDPTASKASKASKVPETTQKENKKKDNDFPFEHAYSASKVEDVEDKSYLMYPLIMEGDVVLLAAEPKAGKTLSAMNISLHMAAGLEMGSFMKPIGKDGNITKHAVVYFALEGQGAIRKRLRAWLKTQQTTMTEKDLHLYVVEDPLNLNDEQKRQELVDNLVLLNLYYQEKGWGSLKMIVFDTFTKIMPGKDQNSVEDTSAVFAIIGLMKKSGLEPSVMFVHHNDKANKGPRGSTNITAEPDTILSVKRDEDVMLDDHATKSISLQVYRARTIDDEQQYRFALQSVDLGENSQNVPETAPVLVPITMEEETATEGTLRKSMQKNREEFYRLVVEHLTTVKEASLTTMHRIMGSRAPNAVRTYYAGFVAGTDHDQLRITWTKLLSEDNLPKSAAALDFTITDNNILSCKVKEDIPMLNHH